MKIHRDAAVMRPVYARIMKARSLWFGRSCLAAMLVVGVVIIVGVGCTRSRSEQADAGPTSPDPQRIASCDRSAQVGTCSDYGSSYLAQNEALLKSSCGKLGGVFLFAACPNTSNVGACTFSTGEVRRFYGTGASAYDPEKARTECEKIFRGTWQLQH